MLHSGTGAQSYLPDLSFSSMQYLEKLGVISSKPSGNKRETSRAMSHPHQQPSAAQSMSMLEQCPGNQALVQRSADGSEERYFQKLAFWWISLNWLRIDYHKALKHTFMPCAQNPEFACIPCRNCPGSCTRYLDICVNL